MGGADIFLAFIAVLFPPLAVWVKRGLCSVDSLLNILLSSLGYVPGLLHAWYIIAKYPEELQYERVPPQDYEGGHGRHGERVTYVFIPSPQVTPQPQAQGQAKPGPNPAMNYGTTDNSNRNNENTAAGASSSAGPSQGSEHHAPPTYAEAVKGDHKIQSHD
ncbi:putative stress response RCI peptide [Poronia punctata]|nr:putative stress response RCI peptide [Poronia punctata]